MNIVNVVVAWVLVEGVWGLPALGVLGAALGSAVGRVVGGVLVVSLLLRGRAGLLLRWRGPDLEMVRRMLRVGLPAGLDQLVSRLGMLAYVRVLSALGTAAFAAHQIALNGESISFMPGWGFAVAATTLVGQGLGARDEKRAEKDAMLTFYIAAAFMSVMGVVFIADNLDVDVTSLLAGRQLTRGRYRIGKQVQVILHDAGTTQQGGRFSERV